MTDFQRKILIFSIGSVGYGIIEIANRGFTHWSMLLTGGWCFLVLYHINDRFALAPLWKKCLVGASVITTAELLVGCVVNIWLGWDVWDYSAYRFNLWGQICLSFFVIWFFLSIPVYFLSSMLQKAADRMPFQ